MSEDLNRLPIIKLWNQILVPLQGEITDEMADRLRSNVLEKIHATGADGLVIDVTGVWTIDSHLCAVISRLAASAQLMGTRSIICGMSADIAMTLQTMGIDLSGIRTALTVEEAFAILGVRQMSRKTTGAPRASAGKPGAERAVAPLAAPDKPSPPSGA
jgi:rsbT antagonist protein RsbS